MHENKIEIIQKKALYIKCSTLQHCITHLCNKVAFFYEFCQPEKAGKCTRSAESCKKDSTNKKNANQLRNVKHSMYRKQ